LRDNEPFTDVYQQASYINSDAFLFGLKRWGLPSKLYAHMLGGYAPEFGFNVVRFIRHIPLFLRMLYISRGRLSGLYDQLRDFEQEINRIEAMPESVRQNRLLNWYLRLHVFIVQANLVINTAIATSLGQGIKSKVRFYDTQTDRPHRVPFETDPASPRTTATCPTVEQPPAAHWLTRVLLTLGLPGTGAYLVSQREWFRDNYTRLHFRLHHALAHYEKTSPHWFIPHPYARSQQGGFWQDDGIVNQQDNNFVIYPGDVRGHVGQDVLIVESLDPGQLEHYRKFKAVIARIGGSLSHGAILLRENAIPSAIITDTPELPFNTPVRLNLNQLTCEPCSTEVLSSAPTTDHENSDSPRDTRGTLWFIYDGQCPLCNTAAKAYRIRKAVGDLQVIDARSDNNHPVLIDVIARGYQLDEGMVIKWNDHYYQGADALIIMALVGTSQGWYNRINALLFRSRWVARLLYPSLRGTRNLLLKVKSVPPIGGITR
jgi:predicted DCC family thiol-disulfide oxidoreductase YuxK